jgi:plasmid stability protein
MVNRKGVFIGAYVPRDLKETLQRRAAAEHRTLSQEITRILTEAVHGKQLPPGMVDRRAVGSPLRRRDTDPPERRRRGDLPVGKGEPPSDSGGES